MSYLIPTILVCVLVFKLITRSPHWLYKIDEELVLEHSRFSKASGYSNQWVRFEGNKMIISKNYAWDGCSPTFSVLGLFTVGIPNGATYLGKPWTYHASLVHDVMCQFQRDLPFNSDERTQVFDDFLRRREFPLRRVYVTVVKYIGVPFFKA